MDVAQGLHSEGSAGTKIGLALKDQGSWPLDLVGESAIYWFKRNTVQPVSVCEREKARQRQSTRVRGARHLCHN